MAADSIKRAVEGEPGVVSAHTVAGEASALLARDGAGHQGAGAGAGADPGDAGVTRTVTEVVLSTLFAR